MIQTDTEEWSEKYARTNKLGLWKSESPMAPWEYRKYKREGNLDAIKKATPYTPDRVVYVTKSGKKYHPENCYHLRGKSSSMTLKEAEAKGYEACSNF